MKVQSIYVCQNCGAQSPKMLGRCPECGEWGTLTEQVVSAGTQSQRSMRLSGSTTLGGGEPAQLLQDIEVQQERRIDTLSSEFNRVLGGGLVPGSLVLLGGEPGIGKSTLALQVLMRMRGTKALYASGEESTRQLKLRAERISGDNDRLYIMSETNLDNILQQVRVLQPEVVVIDSIQTIGKPDMESAIGSLSQVRECTSALMHEAKQSNVPFIIIGHINKEGSLAGPKVLEHIVDTVLQFEGDQHYLYRIVRAQKNRFGSTSEIGIFEMRSDGLREVVNPSELLLTANHDSLSGIAIAAAIEGIRPLLIEVQALVSTAAYGTPQRSSTGFDVRRLNMLLAVLEKRIGFKLPQKDVFLNIAGGIRTSDPAADLPVLAAILSSNMDLPIKPGTCLAGEVGLAGEIRQVNRLEQRIKEADKLGFKKIIIPEGQKTGITHTNIEVIPVRKVNEALQKVVIG